MLLLFKDHLCSNGCVCYGVGKGRLKGRRVIMAGGYHVLKSDCLIENNAMVMVMIELGCHRVQLFLFSRYLGTSKT